MQIKIVKKMCVCLFLFIVLNIVLFNTAFADEVSSPNISSPSALLMEPSTGKILYEKNINEKMYPASLTKILTAIIVLENCDLNDVATVSYDAVMSLSSGYVTANLQVGEELTIEQLLYVLMVGSSNDAAIVLAEHVSGSVEAFCELMNQKAVELGCTYTNFVNPNGVHDNNHYSTAHDLALMAKYAMENETFRTLVSTTSYKLSTTNKYDREDRLFTTTNALLIVNNNSRADNYYYKYATGIKTGFTTPAGNCLVASSKKENLELLTVVLGGTQTSDGLSQRYLDTINLFEYGYENYTMREILKSGSVVQTVNVNNATRDTKKLDAVVSKDVYVLIKQEDRNSALLPQVKLNDNLKAPVKKGDLVGSVTYLVEDIEYKFDLIANSDVKKSRTFLRVVEVLFILFLLCLYLKYKQKTRKKKRLKSRYIR